MANTLINPSVIAKEALFQLENNCVMGDKVHREYKHEFVKIGDSVSIRKPVKFVVTDGVTRVSQDVTEQTTSITINQRKHISWDFSSRDLTLTIEEYSERYIKPAMIQLANDIDTAVAAEGALAFFNAVGTPGTTPGNFDALAAVAERMDDLAVPDDMKRCLVLNPAARWAMASGLQTVFNAEITKDTVRRGRLGEIANFHIYGDQNIYRHTVGDVSGTPLVNGTISNGVSVVPIDGNGGTFKKGDIVTFTGVNAINPVSRADLGYLKQFVVTADQTGPGNLSIYPELNDGSTASTAAYQTCSALPADNAPVVLLGTAGQTYAQNLGFHKNALALVTVPLELPDSAVFKARANWKGHSIRVIKGFDIDDDVEAIRLDTFYGVKAIYPELGVRLVG